MNNYFFNFNEITIFDKDKRKALTLFQRLK